MFVIIWGFVGFYMVLFIAAIKGVPAEIYDAARIDGAGRLRMTFSVTIPLIRDTVQTAYIYLGILALDAFVYTQALTPEGGPEQLDARHDPGAVQHGVHRRQGRPGQCHGRRARRRHARVRRDRVHRQPRWPAARNGSQMA